MKKLLFILLFFPLFSFAQITISETPKFIEEIEVKKTLQIDSLSDWYNNNEAWSDEQKGNKFDYKIYKGVQIYFPTNTIDSLVFTTEEKSIPNINETEVYKSDHVTSNLNSYANKYFNVLDVFTATNERDSISKLLGGNLDGEQIFKLQEKDTNNDPIYCDYNVLIKSILLPHYIKFKNLFEGKEFILANRMNSEDKHINVRYDFGNQRLTKEVFYDFNNQQLITAETNSVWICKELTLFNNFDMRFFKNSLDINTYNGIDNLPLEDRKKLIVSYENYLDGTEKEFSNHPELKILKNNSQNKLYTPYLVLQNKLHPEQLIAIEFDAKIHYKKFVDFEYGTSYNVTMNHPDIIYPDDEIPGFVLKDRYDSMKLLYKLEVEQNDIELKKYKEKQKLQQQKEKAEYDKYQLARKSEIISKYGQELGSVIANGRVRIGMSKQMCIDAWGNTIVSNKIITEKGTVERLQYGRGVLYFFNGTLKRIEQ